MENLPDKKKNLAKRLTDSTKTVMSHTNAHREVMRKFGKYDNSRADELRGELKRTYKSIDRHESKEIKKKGRGEVKNIKGKNNYMIHLTDRARRRGEPD